VYGGAQLTSWSPSVTAQAATAGCMGRASQNSGQAHVAPALGCRNCLTYTIPQPAQEHLPSHATVMGRVPPSGRTP
jgi:hypothetical protein